MSNSDQLIKEIESILEEFNIPRKEFDLKAFRKLLREDEIPLFKELVEYAEEEDIYSGKENITFKEKYRDFQIIMLREFGYRFTLLLLI